MNTPKKIIAGLLWNIGFGPLIRVFCEPERLIVCYHSVADGGGYEHIRISIHDFTRQIEYLAARGYRFVKFSELAGAQGRAAAIYFDDGFRSVLAHARPILEKKNIPATLFITTSYADGAKDHMAYASWDELAVLGDSWEIGSHSVSHRKLNKLSKEEAEQEMTESKKNIEERLGKTVAALSYPHGRASTDTELMARQAGFAATTADKRFHKVRPDPDDSSETFYWKTLKLW